MRTSFIIPFILLLLLLPISWAEYQLLETNRGQAMSMPLVLTVAHSIVIIGAISAALLLDRKKSYFSIYGLAILNQLVMLVYFSWRVYMFRRADGDKDFYERFMNDHFAPPDINLYIVSTTIVLIIIYSMIKGLHIRYRER